jgi:hypothetical protein
VSVPDSRSRRLQRRYLPYRYDEYGMDLQATSFRLDGGEELEDVNQERRLISLENRTEWDEITVEGEIELGQDVINDVLPVEERLQPPAEIYITNRCEYTYLREKNSVEDSPVEPRVYEFEITLEREKLRNTTVLKPYLARVGDSDAGTDEFATVKGARLASSRPWEIRTDIREGPSGDYLEVLYDSFDDKDYLPDEDRLYHLDFREAKSPTLWLNSDHEKITRVLDSRGSRGPEARMRDVFFDQISQSVWTQLIVRAATDIDEEGEGRYEWEEGILKRFADRIYPEVEEKEARKKLSRDIRSPEELPEIMERIDGVLQDRLESHDNMTKVIEEALDE